MAEWQVQQQENHWESKLDKPIREVLNAFFPNITEATDLVSRLSSSAILPTGVGKSLIY